MAIILLLVSLVAISIFYLMRPKEEKIVLTQAVQINGTYLPKAIPLSDFHLTDNHGKPFSKENMKGHWTMMLFGFTHCGYVCPVTLSELNELYNNLGKTLSSKNIPHIVFVTVDPERDTVAKMNTYINSFNTNFIGVRGGADETEKLQNQLHIIAVKVKPAGQSDDQYGVDHSVEILLFNPDAELQAYMAYPHKAKQMEKDYYLILAQNIALKA